MSDDFYALPPFNAAEGLTQLKRQLRELRGLAERAGGFEINGRTVVTLALTSAGDAIETRLAKRAAVTPEWEKSTLKTNAEQRRFLDAVKGRLARWSDDD